MFETWHSVSAMGEAVWGLKENEEDNEEGGGLNVKEEEEEEHTSIPSLIHINLSR